MIRIYLLWLKPKLLIWDTFVNSHKLLSLYKVFRLSLAPLQSLIKIYFIQTDEVTQAKHYKESTEKTLKFWQAFFQKVIIKQNIVLIYEQSCPTSLGWVDELQCSRWMIVISLFVFIKCWFSKIFLAVSTKITCVFWRDGKVFKTKRSKTFVNLRCKQIIAVHVQSWEIRSDEIGYSSDEFNVLSLSCDLNRPINRWERRASFRHKFWHRFGSVRSFDHSMHVLIYFLHINFTFKCQEIQKMLT